MMARNQQNDAIAGGDRVLEAAVDRAPGTIQTHSVEVEHPVRL
jgi:hypothetical protein